MSIKFEQGQIYHTVKTLGVITKEDGRLQISQRLGKEGIADIEASENLMFIGRDGGKLWFQRDDGSKVCGHRSHFDPEDAYNTGETEPKDPKARRAAADARVAKAEQELIRATERLHALTKELGQPIETEAPTETQATGEGYIAPSDDARAAARAMFAESN